MNELMMPYAGVMRVHFGLTALWLQRYINVESSYLARGSWRNHRRHEVEWLHSRKYVQVTFVLKCCGRLLDYIRLFR